MRQRVAPLSLTDSAAERVKALLAGRETPALGLRIGVNPKGCAGQSYSIDFAETTDALDEVVHSKGVTVVIEAKALMYLIGTELDYVEDKMQSSFVFRNPNEKGRCGCGESFHV
jgi:iron-sulfur cluster assembly protein